MTSDLRELYERFDQYLARLNGDIEAAVRDLPETRRAGFLVPRLDFAEFSAFWVRVSADPVTTGLWMRRLSPGGYEAERESIRRAFDRVAGQPPTAHVRGEAAGRAAA
jgi:hypothetical protein